MTQALPRSPSPAPGGPIRAGARPSPERAAAAARVLGVSPAPVTPAPGERRLRVVGQPGRSLLPARYRTRVLLLAAVGAALAVAFALVYLHVLLAQRQFRLDRVNSQVQNQQITYQKLRLEVAQLASPENIISTAEGKLGMIPPGRVSYLSPATTIPSSSTVSTLSFPGGPGGQAPAGDADWPRVKSELAGSP
jgi:cell division protein FtsL